MRSSKEDWMVEKSRTFMALRIFWTEDSRDSNVRVLADFTTLTSSSESGGTGTCRIMDGDEWRWDGMDGCLGVEGTNICENCIEL